MHREFFDASIVVDGSVMTDVELRDQVRERYAAAALAVTVAGTATAPLPSGPNAAPTWAA
jgi:hypothetical protein